MGDLYALVPPSLERSPTETKGRQELETPWWKQVDLDSGRGLALGWPSCAAGAAEDKKAGGTGSRPWGNFSGC